MTDEEKPLNPFLVPYEDEEDKAKKEQKSLAKIFKQGIRTKPIYEMSVDLQNEELMPSVDSYGDSRVFIRYKMNKWFEGMNVIRLKRE